MIWGFTSCLSDFGDLDHCNASDNQESKLIFFHLKPLKSTTNMIIKKYLVQGEVLVSARIQVVPMDHQHHLNSKLKSMFNHMFFLLTIRVQPYAENTFVVLGNSGRTKIFSRCKIIKLNSIIIKFFYTHFFSLNLEKSLSMREKFFGRNLANEIFYKNIFSKPFRMVRIKVPLQSRYVVLYPTASGIKLECKITWS